MKKQKILDRKIHENREDLVGEHTFGDMGQVILLLIFLTVWIADSFFLHYSTFLSNYVSLWVKIPMAAIILVIAGALAWEGMKIVFGETREKPAVIREGVFNLVRHPIYLGAILGYLGMIILTLSLAATLVLIIIIIFYHFIARHEEKLLLENFGKDYEEYVREVPMWIPRLIRK
jgi:protein-S-isoprenylcysteine O-methyltransferase Ste14